MIGKTVLSRIGKLFDDNSFQSFMPDGDNCFVTGCGKVDGRDVMASFTEPDVVHESIFAGIQDHLALLEKALEKKVPVVFVLDEPARHKSAGRTPFPNDPVRLLADKNGVGRMYSTHARLSGKVPQVAVVLNRLGAAQTFPVALCDAAVMIEAGGMCIGRPDVVEEVSGLTIDYAELGGAAMHYSGSGSIDHVAPDEAGAFAWTRNYLGYMTQNRKQEFLPPELDEDAAQDTIPASPNTAFDTHEVIRAISDAGTLFELRAGWPGNL